MLSLAWLAAASLWAAPSVPLYVQRSTDPVIVVWPPEGLSMPYGEGEFVFGSIVSPKGKLAINGAPVSVYRNGAFLAWLPIKPGTFTFHCELNLDESTAAFDRTISVVASPPPLPEKPPAIDQDSLWPKADVELRPGDWMIARMRASPRQSAKFKLPKRDWQSLRESPPGSGNYEGAYLVAPNDDAAAEPVEFRLGSGWSSVSAASKGKVTVSAATPPIAIVRSPQLATVKTAPGAGYMVFPGPGTRFVTAGRAGTDVKVRLADGLYGWMDARDLEILPAGTPPPRAELGTIRVSAAKDGATLKLSLSDRVPYSIEESEDLSSLSIRLFYTYGHVNTIVYDAADPFIKEVRWRQEASDVAVVTVRLNRELTLWGYQPQYEPGALAVEIRRAPALAPSGSPLAGRTIFLDPGHMPSASGATGPMGTKEMDANYAIAKAVAARLSEEGAVPLISRDSPTHELSLVDRPRLAIDKKADIFVSLHNNALSDGDNPFAHPMGFELFYYHPHSLTLASEMYRSYQKTVPLPGEGMRYGNLLVARLSAMPAILVESAYMIIPEQEAMLNDPAFRETLAKAVVDGLRGFFEHERRAQAKLRPAEPVKPKEKPAAKAKKKKAARK